VNTDNIKGNLEIKPVKWIEEVLAVALTQQPAIPADATAAAAAAAAAAVPPGNDVQSGDGKRRRRVKVVPAH